VLPSLPFRAQSVPYYRVHVEVVHKREQLSVRPERSRVAAKSKDNALARSFNVDVLLPRVCQSRATL